MEDMTPDEINQEHKQLFADLTEKLGRVPTSNDAEWWKITDLYSARHRELINGKKPEKAEEAPFPFSRPALTTEQKAERDERRKENPGQKVVLDPQFVVPITKDGNACKDCGNVIPPTGRRGRPATRCDDCKAKVNV